MFTDEDLKRLKKRLSNGPGEVIMLTESAFTLAALLARLEAAEKIVTRGSKCSCLQECDYCSEAYLEWRKAAGKA